MTPAEKQIKSRLRNGVIAGVGLTVLSALNAGLPVISGINPGTMTGFLLKMFGDTEQLTLTGLLTLPSFIILNAVSIILLAGLTFGLYKKNLVCGYLLLFYGIMYLALNINLIFSGAPWLVILAVLISTALVFLVFSMMAVTDYRKTPRQPPV